jgi:hypothetical protein
VTGSDHEGGGRGGRRPTPERGNQPTDPLEEPVASRATLARRLRTVERAVSGSEGVEFENRSGARDPGTTDERLGSMDERIDAVEERTEALHRAVRTLGEFVVARGRARRTEDGIESVQLAIAALPDATDEGDGIDRNEGDDRSPDRGVDSDTVDTTGTDVAPGALDPGTTPDGTGTADGGGSPTEWLDRVASGGVTPPPVE